MVLVFSFLVSFVVEKTCIAKKDFDMNYLPSQGVEKYDLYDVLCARGNGVRDHPGNVRYRSFVDALRDDCVAAAKQEKPLFARVIVARIRGFNPPGRFLRKGEEKYGQNPELWYDIGDKSAIAKTSQALREGATAIRKKSMKIQESHSTLESGSPSQSTAQNISNGITFHFQDCPKTKNNFLTDESLNIVNKAICVAKDAIQLEDTKEKEGVKERRDPVFVSSSSIEENAFSKKNTTQSYIGRHQSMDRNEDMLEEWNNFDDTSRRDSIIDENGLEEWGTFQTHNRTHRAFDSLDRSIYVSENSMKFGSTTMASQLPNTTAKCVSFRESIDEKIVEAKEDGRSKNLNESCCNMNIQSLVENIDTEIDHRLTDISLSSGTDNNFTRAFKENAGMLPKKPRFGSLSLSHSSDAKQRLLRCSSLTDSGQLRSRMSICSIFSSDGMNDCDSRVLHNFVDELIEDERAKVKNAIAAKGEKMESLTDEDFLSLYTSDISEMVLSFRSLNSIPL